MLCYVMLCYDNHYFDDGAENDVGHHPTDQQSDHCGDNHHEHDHDNYDNHDE